MAITGNVDFINVNLFENNGMLNVGGDFSMDTSGESEDSEWDNDGTANISGNFTYIGGDEVDDVFINDGTTIGGKC